MPSGHEEKPRLSRILVSQLEGVVVDISDETSGIRFLLVVEVPPWNFSERATPKVAGARMHPVPWEAYFTACMCDAGFPDCKSVSPGSHFVPALSIVRQPIMERIVRNELDECGIAGFPDSDGDVSDDVGDRVGSLSGGIAVVGPKGLLIEPQCCGELKDVSEWRGALSSNATAGTIWVGHPELSFAAKNGVHTLTEEWARVGLPNHRSEVAIPTGLLLRLLDRVEAEQASFHSRLRDVLASMEDVAPLVDVVAPLLAGVARA